MDKNSVCLSHITSPSHQYLTSLFLFLCGLTLWLSVTSTFNIVNQLLTDSCALLRSPLFTINFVIRNFTWHCPSGQQFHDVNRHYIFHAFAFSQLQHSLKSEKITEFCSPSSNCWISCFFIWWVAPPIRSLTPLCFLKAQFLPSSKPPPLGLFRLSLSADGLASVIGMTLEPDNTMRDSTGC